ncbi:MAG TPA: hypothetical protein VF981_02395 [Gemmatimonadaceae bacterium]
MKPRSPVHRFLAVLPALALAACVDGMNPTSPGNLGSKVEGSLAQIAPQAQQRAALFARASAEVLALPQTVFADDDETTDQLVFGVEQPGVANSIRGVMARQGIPASAFRIEVTEPIRFLKSLQDEFRPTIGGIQIHFPGYLCTLGFNVSHAGGRSFITNSHCTNTQGENDGTQYWQPLSTVNGTQIAHEADDPAYSSSGCSAGLVCRRSDAARAVYEAGVESTQGAIAKTTDLNSLTYAGEFSITEQSSNDTFSGTINKVGRTTGWTAGNVSATCVTVNVSGTSYQLLCQTMVFKRGKKIVGSGDSGSPAFQIISGDNVRLVGILWGGSFSGDRFVFSPVKNIVAELGGFDATGAGSGGGGEDPPEDPPCIPRGNGRNCK